MREQVPMNFSFIVKHEGICAVMCIIRMQGTEQSEGPQLYSEAQLLYRDDYNLKYYENNTHVI